MIKKLLAGTAMAIVPAIAMAADLPMRAPAPAPIFVAAAPTWNGFYVGANFGVAWTAVDSFWEKGCCDSPWRADDENGSTLGGLAGVTAGYNFQAGSFVYGLEADIAGVWGGEVKNSFYDMRVETRAIGTLRARAGIASGSTLFYLTGGVAAVNQKMQATYVTCCPTFNNFSSTKWDWAPVVGVGLEHQLGGGWSAKVEGLYIPNVDSPTARLSSEFDRGKGFRAESNIAIVRFGVNYRFGASAAPVGPVVARY